MTLEIYSNCIGTFLFKDNVIIEEKIFRKEDIKNMCDLLDSGNILPAEEEFLKKNKDAKLIDKKSPPPMYILDAFADEKHRENLRKATLIITKRKIAQSLRPDHLIIQAINNVDEIDKVSNNLSKRLREWYELYNPEFSKSIESHEKFAELIQKMSRKDLLKDLGMTEEESMGADILEEDLIPIMDLARQITDIESLRERQVRYIENAMKTTLPNVTAICGHMIGAKLLSIAGSLEKLAMFPASTVQLLGAEKALFRHIKTGAKPPKFGVLINHPLVAKAKPKEKGKAARMIADKVSIAAKIDFFKGEFRGDDMRKDLEERLS